MRHRPFLCVLLLLFGSTGAAGEVGFLEDFAWSDNRAETLKQLIPGTEDYYFFHCLHYQNTQQFDAAERVLKDWLGRHRATARYQLMENRQRLLTYGVNSDQALRHISNKLNLRFDHQRERIGEKPNLPNALDPAAISRAQLMARAMGESPTLSGFEDSALEWLRNEKLDDRRLRDLLQRLQRPDYDNLLDLIQRDLRTSNSGGLGSLPIHARLTLEQLDDLARRMPELLNHGNYVAAYVAKLQPNDDEDWRNDTKTQTEYLDRLWAFAQRLGPVQNSLKAHVLYHRIEFDRSRGEFDKERFLAYLQLPRNCSYINPDYVRREEHRQFVAQLGQEFNYTLLPAVGNDEPLVRDVFLHFFRTEDSYDPYLPLVQTDYVKQVFAEAKVVNGLGNPEQWASLLTPAAYQALKERIDLDFDPRNRPRFHTEEAVSLDVNVKNVKQLIVKVFHINTESHARQTLQEVNTNIELDGLVPNQELKFD
ncbi:MAG: hypothetical protein KDB14_23070, partial [Planctomycetales bacterium]|nr:hypothetical protein [Planctomycetales bacterium]